MKMKRFIGFIWLIIAVYLFIGVGTAVAQLNGTFKTVRYVNAPTDENNILPVNGTIYYNEDSLKFRAYENGVWKDLIGTSAGFQPLINAGLNEVIWKDVDGVIRGTSRITYDSLLDVLVIGQGSTSGNTQVGHNFIVGNNSSIPGTGQVNWGSIIGSEGSSIVANGGATADINNSGLFTGFDNTITGNDGSAEIGAFVIGGTGNDVVDSNRGGIIGGLNNVINGHDNSIILAGSAITSNASNTVFAPNYTMVTGTGVLDLAGNDLLWKTQGTTDMVNDATIDMLDNTVTLRGTNDIAGFFGTLWDYNNQFFAVGDFNAGTGAGNFTYSGGSGRALFTSPNGTGIEYFSDYEPTFVDRTLVTKQYVDNRTPGAVFAVDTLWLRSWDMTATTFVGRNLSDIPTTTADVISIDVTIISDAGIKSKVTTAADGGAAGTTTVDAWVNANAVNVVTVTRLTAQGYDDAEYDDTAINRGFIIVTYIP